ncbi:MAG: AraC family transcriptional regulator [Anaerotignum sp.]|nr:AraC family transcriptional regulator [Anaerotignum sp.]
MNPMNPFYEEHLSKYDFTLIAPNGMYNPLGKLWKLSQEIGSGYFWVYSEENLFHIKIHNFAFHEDFMMDYLHPECLSISYYESISGDEFSPYRRLNANCIKSYLGGKTPFKALIHKKVPIKSIGIEITPDYYKEYLSKKFSNEAVDLSSAFLSIDETENFPEMLVLLKQIENYRGDGFSAKLFYEAKVTEAISLIVERKQKTTSYEKAIISNNDAEQIQNVTAYINDHACLPLTLEQLSKIACMGTTKLKQTFKMMNQCTITEYIQNRRMAQAEFLLSRTDLSIEQIAKMVGYSNPSRFAELFHKNTGILPNLYRKITK